MLIVQTSSSKFLALFFCLCLGFDSVKPDGVYILSGALKGSDALRFDSGIPPTAVSTATSCSNKCTRTSMCQSFKFDEKSGTCYFFKGQTTYSGRTGGTFVTLDFPSPSEFTVPVPRSTTVIWVCYFLADVFCSCYPERPARGAIGRTRARLIPSPEVLFYERGRGEEHLLLRHWGHSANHHVGGTISTHS